jgi:hypothetical protein
MWFGLSSHREQEALMERKDQHRVATVSVDLEESSDQTQAHVSLDLGDRHFGGWGRARRNPHDPDIPRIGEELAIARALSDLSHQLVDVAAAEIEDFEGKPVNVHD